MTNKNFGNLRAQARKLLFEQASGYPMYSDSSWADGERAGTQFVDDGPEEEDPMDMPISPAPQMATQLSEDEPPVDDPEYSPVNTQDLARALYALAHKLPNDAKIAGKTYEKFKKFVDDHEVLSVQVNDQAGMNEPEEVQEAREHIRNQLLIRLMREGSWDEFDLLTHPDDDEEEDWRGPSEEDLEAVERGDPHAGEVTLAQVAKEMGISTSGAKKLEADALKHYRLIYDDFPNDMDKIRPFALEFFANALLELDAIDEEDAAELKAAPNAALGWNPLRHFIWDGFLTNVYNKMVRDAKKQGLDPVKQLKDLTPGLYERAKAYFDGLPHSKLMQSVVNAMNVEY
jgi:hypothetical protein